MVKCRFGWRRRVILIDAESWFFELALTAGNVRCTECAAVRIHIGEEEEAAPNAEVRSRVWDNVLSARLEAMSLVCQDRYLLAWCVYEKEVQRVWNVSSKQLRIKEQSSTVNGALDRGFGCDSESIEMTSVGKSPAFTP